MKIAYASMTGNVQRFVDKLKNHLPNYEFVRVVRQMKIDEPFILITYTTGFGEIPKEVEELLQLSSDNLIAVIGSGNRNWGHSFCGGAVKVADMHSVPLLHKFELSGLDSDVRIVTNKIGELEKKG
jgi:protein involved in ribonucleotide reduction